MVFNINYQKKKNTHLFNKLESPKTLHLDKVQNYIPIYSKFFSLNQSNYNLINLNHVYHVCDLKEKNNNNDLIFDSKLKHITNDESFTINSKIYIKIAPLLDPCKYILGKYNHLDPNLLNLPDIDKKFTVHPKILDENNAAYVDSFFYYLTSQLLNEHKFIHGTDFYGSFLGIKNNFKIDVIDDIDYLIQSDFFNKNKGILFNVDDYSHLIINEPSKPLKPLTISDETQNIDLTATQFDEEIFDDLFENNVVHLKDCKDTDMELLDVTSSFQFNLTENKKTATIKSGSSCSSRTSHTNNSVSSNIENDEEDDSNDNSEDNTDKTVESGTSYSTEEESLFLQIPKFPVQVICLEQGEFTFDHLILNKDLTNDEWFSALMQIIMTLITYQKIFSFTHNDLHTNNVIYVSTKEKFIYYYYNKKYYKVPTFGKIFKIIDFGRAIYKFNGKVICSDSFQVGNDAHTQYNCEPYFNEKKPRLEPNFSFDLCRLACSIFDYIIEDVDDVKDLSKCSEIIKLIVDWCMDDNGLNVLYKNDGAERYPDFKLYKMIARCVHNHTPANQLERSSFKKYMVAKNNVPKGAQILNIDDYPIYI